MAAFHVDQQGRFGIIKLTVFQGFFGRIFRFFQIFSGFFEGVIKLYFQGQSKARQGIEWVESKRQKHIGWINNVSRMSDTILFPGVGLFLQKDSATSLLFSQRKFCQNELFNAFLAFSGIFRDAGHFFQKILRFLNGTLKDRSCRPAMISSLVSTRFCQGLRTFPHFSCWVFGNVGRGVLC